MTDDGTLFHYTCAHGRRDIGTGNCLLLPHLHPWIGGKLLWLTDQADADRELTGLTMKITRCDRMAFRYVVADRAACRPWLGSPERARVAETRLVKFETLEDGRPAAFEHWWIADRPVRARFDRSWPP